MKCCVIKTAAVLVMIAGALCFSSCTKKDSGKTASPDKAAAEKGAAQTQSAKPLTLWVYDKGRIDVLTALGKEFEAEYGVPVEVSLVDLGLIRTQMLLSSGGTECADLAIIPHDNLGSLVENAAAAPVSLGTKKDSFLEAAVSSFTYNGKLYGLPLSVENIGFFYNKTLVPNPPATWDEAVSIAQKLIKDKKCEVMMGLPDATYNAYPVYDSFGGSIFGKKADGSLDPAAVQIADTGFVKGLEFLTMLASTGLTPKSIDWDASHVLFEAGKAPFVMTGPWAIGRFRTAGVPYGIAKFPAASKGGKNGSPFLGVQGIIISASGKQQLLAQTFAVDFIARKENMEKLFKADQRPSAWKAIFENTADPDTAGFNAAGAQAVPMPSIPAMGYVWDSWVAAAALSFAGEKTPQDALSNAKLQIETQIKNAK